MTHPYSRKLDNLDLIEGFLRDVVRYEDYDDNNLLTKIKSGEAELKNYDNNSSTLNSTTHRSRKYKEANSRWKLRAQIVNELYTLKREDDDDKIELLIGGALPNGILQSEKQAYIVIGLPASGKSNISNQIADHFGAVILDSDFAKRKLPEFKDNPAGASLVHEESDKLIFGFDPATLPDGFLSLFECCSENGDNIVIPKIGHNHRSINKLATSLERFGYQVHLILVSLDRRLATKRAINRFKETGRYVPLSLIFDGYGNDPILTFYRLKDGILIDKQEFISFGKISTDVPKGQKPKIIYKTDNSPVTIFE
ncbi:MAG: hypothetical protein BGO31_14835 [Bacteroidetes bacterium 43-16]|nr:MAG: hypothetical protein BGO31_14835 [Bacteroidetes bacterium 43-16]